MNLVKYFKLKEKTNQNNITSHNITVEFDVKNFLESEKFSLKDFLWNVLDTNNSLEDLIDSRKRSLRK